MGSNDPLIAEYRAGALQSSSSNPETSNAGHDRLHAAFKELRKTEPGRMEIERLMADEVPHVRLWAAAHCLTWANDRARPVLIELVLGRGPRSFDAKMTLEEFDKGTLSFDY
jgi:hypothetical protein